MTLRPQFRAALWIVGSLASFSAMSVAGRELGDDMSVAQILTVRAGVGTVLTTIAIGMLGWHQLRLSGFEFRVLVLRNVAHFGATYGWFLGLTLLPLAQVFAIEFTMPVWAALLSIVVLGERPGRARACGIALGLLGTMIILRPTPSNLDPAALIVLLAAFGFAVSVVSTKRVIANIPTVTFLFYMSILQLPIGLWFTGADWAPIVGVNWGWILVTSLGGLTAHFCLVRALRLADASLVAPMDFVRLPLIAAVGAVVYDERLAVWVLAGAAVVCLGNWINLRDVDRRPPADPAQPR